MVCGGEADVLESGEIAQVHSFVYPSEVARTSPLIKVYTAVNLAKVYHLIFVL